MLEEHRAKQRAEKAAREAEEEKQRIVEERKRLEEEGKKKALKVAKKYKKSDADLSLSKNKSALPPKSKDNIESLPPKHLNTITNDEKFRTGAIQQPIKKDMPAAVEKVTVAPVGQVNKVDSRQVAFGLSTSMTPPPMHVPEPESPRERDDKTPLLLNNEASDVEDEEEYKSNFNINESNNSKKKDKLKSQKTDEDIARLMALDEQRKESMYDIMMKKEESVKSSLSSRKESKAQAETEGYDGDRSRNASQTTGVKTSMNSNRNQSTFATSPPKTFVGEPVTQSSCFGGCMNWVMGIFRRN